MAWPPPNGSNEWDTEGGEGFSGAADKPMNRSRDGTDGGGGHYVEEAGGLPGELRALGRCADNQGGRALGRQVEWARPTTVWERWSTSRMIGKGAKQQREQTAAENWMGVLGDWSGEEPG